MVDRLQCPECRENHQIPVGGVEAFKTNRYVLQNLDLIESNVRLAAEQESTVKAVIEGDQAIIQREIPLVNLHGENRH